MRLKHLLLLLLTCSVGFVYPQSNKRNLQRPKLVVGIVIDQMRWDYLYRYFDRYDNDGFRRLLKEGFSCENTYIPYIPTYTAIGHSTIYTGSVPSIHGIAGNDFIVQSSGTRMYCTEDPEVESVGTSSKAGKMSPKNLLASTITDELKLATNFRSKVIGIALKDRGGILPAGHAADAAYWYDDLTGNWISSTFYMKGLPSWVQDFNAQRLPEKYLDQKWNTLYPIDTYVQSSPDDARKYEGLYQGETAPVFPHDLSRSKNNYGSIRPTPFGNTFTLDFARSAVKNELLGADEITDFLAVSLSSTDYVGHKMGPNSVEAEDMYLRLDKDLGAFLRFLDKEVGKGQYTVFLSADHGAAHNARFLQDNKIPGGFWTGASDAKQPAVAQLNALLAQKYGASPIVRALFNYQVHLDYNLIEKEKLDLQLIKADIIAFFKKQPAVAYVIDLKTIGKDPLPESVKNRVINGYNEKRSGEIQIVLYPGWYQGDANGSTGTTHGTWNPYDAHIPLVFSGWGIQHGKSNQEYFMTDIAATLAALLRIQEPSGNIGKPIAEALLK